VQRSRRELVTAEGFQDLGIDAAIGLKPVNDIGAVRRDQLKQQLKDRASTEIVKVLC
jgi:hypothetical protein